MALADCGLTPADVDGFTCFTTGESANATQVAHAIGIDDIGWSATVRGGGNVVASVVACAAAAIVTAKRVKLVTISGRAAEPMAVTWS